MDKPMLRKFLTVRLTEQQYWAIVGRASAQKVSPSVWVRKALSERLDGQAPKEKR